MDLLVFCAVCKCVDVDVDVSLCRPVLKHRPTQRHIYVYIYTLHTAQETSRSMKNKQNYRKNTVSHFPGARLWGHANLLCSVPILRDDFRGHCAGAMLIFSVPFQFNG